MTHADEAAIARVFREEYGQVVATLVRVFGDIDLAEELLPGGVAGFFEVDVPTGTTLEIDLAKLAQNGTPVVAMRSSAAGPAFVAASAGIRVVAPQTREVVMPDSVHMFPIRKPAETAALLDDWFRSRSE